MKVDVRTCKHLKELLGEAYELARTTIGKASKPASKPASSAARTSRSRAKPASTSKPDSRTTRSRKRKAPDDDDLEEEEEEEEKPSASTPKDVKDEKPAQKDAPAVAGDELAEISGIKPKTYLKDGEEREFKSLTRYVRSCRLPYDP